MQEILYHCTLHKAYRSKKNKKKKKKQSVLTEESQQNFDDELWLLMQAIKSILKGDQFEAFYFQGIASELSDSIFKR